MKVTSKEPFDKSGFFPLQDHDWLTTQRKAGKIAAKAINHLDMLVKNKTQCSLIELNDIAEKIIIQDGGIPTFKDYKHFPATVCISVNQQLVHGIPNNYHLQDGDIVKFDLGVTYEEAIADTAITCIYGQPKYDWHVKLVNSAYEALDKGIAAIAIDRHLGVIGNAIYKSVKGNGFAVITKYGGHGLGRDKDGNGVLHAPPFVDNKSEPDSGFRIQPGLVIAVEPMVTQGSTNTRVLSDGWTVVTDGVTSHVEHSIYVHADHVEVITDRTNL